MTVHTPGATVRRSWVPDLDLATFYALLALRAQVFVVEQQCAYQELDGRDLEQGTRHYWLADPDTAEVLATLRLLEEPGGGYRIGRVCTRADARGRGFGHRLMEAALAEAGSGRCVLDAQEAQVGFYARHGFAVAGETFVEDGIPHVPMVRAGR
ncbi:GNAT family N-acetyltransferase [Pseudonocardia sp. C8]|uniref:GNAT family N-acetyltransferase n=1 Tax=Pseudonocardia sp. C8 TaxID=2762759 RepID=UPI001642B678|nr:GNAT family N-acetyltransferase [Pseudonocardia sp. C8]MBC3190800.1 GNAT family N-acetyltransferase [Pseudonocardia sp. C8]